MDSSNATGSPASAAGPSLFDSLDESEKEAFGPPPVHALLSPPLDERRIALLVAESLSLALGAPESFSASSANTPGSPTVATYGQNSIASSTSADLQAFLANKLREETDLSGSPEYELSWSEADMALGRPISRLRASARRTYEIESGGLDSEWLTPFGWPTPKGSEHQISHKRGNPTLYGAAILAGWPTPMAGSPGTENSNGGVKKASNPDDIAVLAGWATPSATTWGGTPEGHLERKAKAIANGSIMGMVVSNLDSQVQLAGWCTPAARDHKDTPGMSATGVNPDGTERTRLDQLPRQAALAGPTPGSSSAETGRGDASRLVLNPAFSLWLQGYPSIWCYCGLLAKRSLLLRGRRGGPTSFEEAATALSLKSQSGLFDSASGGPSDDLNDNPGGDDD